ncbi:uncharacterized protein LOC129596583 [Paramacrobiotus metropolitanus]|uniref:uncharacterized protein LOC129596583 n=1 Tax=Paramacrobiotus metropolitanus TaxID=2943436 RepID=UPI002446080E|nr:uncharacterized protein LOC129596583 [Paramacrobiotus metropolitanus]
MHVYGDDEHPVHAWNAVDVLVDGLLQHGEVIGVANGGLIIDFRCAAQRAQFVEYGRIFRFSDEYDFVFTAYVMQILLRRPIDGAWIWYPGEVSCLTSYINEAFEYVKVQLPHGRVLELVPYGQLRPPPTDKEYEGSRVMEDDFVVRCCRLPEVCCSGGSQLVKELFKWHLTRRFPIVCIAFSSCTQTLDYLQRQDASPLKAHQVESVYAWAQTEEASGCTSTAAQKIFRLVRPANIHAAGVTDPTDGADEARLLLPVELLVEVFQSLDSIDRFRCRRVCPLWNDILTTDAYFSDVRVSREDADYGGVSHVIVRMGTADLFWLPACLLKCLNSTTKMVVITKLPLHRCFHTRNLINDILKRNRIRALVLSDCRFGEGMQFVWVLDNLAELIMEIRQCNTVILKNCSVGDENLRAVVAQHAFSNPMSQEEVLWQLWDLCESCLVLKKPLVGSALAERIAECAGHKRDVKMGDKIVEVLNYYQSLDPRPTTHYRQREWTVSTLSELDVGKLTVLTMTALGKRMDPAK